jgi:amino acid transporter
MKNNDLDDSTGNNVIKKNTEYTPPKSLQTWLIGRPLQTADAPHQTIGKVIGLAVFASDALSSSAYSAEEVLVILAYAGIGAFHYSIPISFGILALLVILTTSYEQTIHAYPGGGGAYIVARDNLGIFPAVLAAAALLTDYILTVAVSISSGVAQITSAYPNLYNNRVLIAAGFVLLIMLINLRGVKESGITFAIPTYYFLITMFITVGVGLFRYATGNLGQVNPLPPLKAPDVLQPVTFFLLLKAFASGTTAITGVEAISNGITAFKEPRSKNAGKTLVWMAVILGTLLVGITFLAFKLGAVPSDEETVFSQMARTIWNSRGILYLAVISSTTVILVMAANTAFADFPRLSALVAADGFLPRQFAFKGSRLVFSRGIMALAGVAILLIIVFQASVTRLIPLYAIGVFLSFTLSQAGMTLRWWKSGHLKENESIKEQGSTIIHDSHWIFKMIVNGMGSITTFIVMIVFATTKFNDGAYVIIILLPLLVVGFYAIHSHYKNIAKKLSLEKYGAPPRIARHRVIIPISGVHRGTLAALRYSRTLSDDITAVHVSIDADETEKIQTKWITWGDGYRLVILDSPYRLMVEPLLQYINNVSETMQPNEILTIVVPQFVPKHWWANALHTQTALILRMALLLKPGIVITDVPYQVD